MSILCTAAGLLLDILREILRAMLRETVRMSLNGAGIPNASLPFGSWHRRHHPQGSRGLKSVEARD